MSKSLYLILLWIMWVNVWNVLPFGLISPDIRLILVLIVLLVGFYMYRNEYKVIKNKFYLTPFYLIITGMFISMISADFFYNQGLLQSLITYRSQLRWLIIPLLVLIRPNIDEIIKSFNVIFCLTAIAYFTKIYQPGLFYFDEISLERLAFSDSYEITIPGYWVAVPLLYWNLMQLREDFQYKRLFAIILFWGFIFLMGNRSTLFPATFILLYSLFSVKSGNKIAIWGLSTLLIGVVLYHTQDIWLEFFEETTSQIDDGDYNRNKAIAYFLSDKANPSWVTYILGNGFLSAHSSATMSSNMGNGIFNSDVGLVGYWNQYGLLPVIVFISMFFFCFKNKFSDYYLRCWAFHFLCCSLTLCYFGAAEHMLNFAFFYYMYYRQKLSDEYQIQDDEYYSYQL